MICSMTNFKSLHIYLPLRMNSLEYYQPKFEYNNMINMTLAEASIILKLNHPITNTSFRGISIDTHTLQKDNLFVAIKGSRVDGHDFIQEAYQKGAALALVSHPVNS